MTPTLETSIGHGRRPKKDKEKKRINGNLVINFGDFIILLLQELLPPYFFFLYHRIFRNIKHLSAFSTFYLEHIFFRICFFLGGGTPTRHVEVARLGIESKV